MGQEKEPARMVDEFTENGYIILEDIRSHIISPEEQQKMYDHFWVGWMMTCICLLCIVNYILGLLKKKDKYD